MSEAERGAIVGGGGVLLVCAGAYALLGGERYTADFTQLWAAGRAVVTGISPYDEAAVLALVPAGAEWPVLPWAYPPWTSLLLAPLGLLPLDVAGRAWSLLSAGMIALAAVWASGARTPGGRAVAAGAGALAFPTLGVVGVGQLVAPAVVGAALLAVFRGARPGAVGLVLLALKPHVGLPVALAHGVWVVATRDPEGARAWRTAAAAGGLLAFGALLVDPTSPATWPAALARLRAHETVAVCDTCASATTASPWVAAALAALAAMVLPGARWRDPAVAVALGTCLGLVFLPYVRNYDHALAIVPLAVAWGRAGPVGRGVLAIAWLLPWTSLGLDRATGTVPYWTAAALIGAVVSRSPRRGTPAP